MTGGSWRPIAAMLAGTAVFLLLFVLLDAVFGRTRMQRRIVGLRVFRVGAASETEPMFRRWRAAGGRAIERSNRLAALALRSEPLLDRAATAMTPNEWLAIRLTGALVLLFAGWMFLPWWFGLGSAIAVIVGTNALLRARIGRRERVFADELPNTLQLILSSLRAGFTLQQAVDAGVREDDGPVAEELRRALSESRINGEFEDALARAGERVRSQEMIWLVMAIRLQREVGGSLADVMETTAGTMRERAFLRRHVKSLSAEGMFSAYILVALPIGIGLLLYITRPDYVGLLFKSGLGLGMLATAGILMVIGGAWLRATVKIEV